MTTNDMVYCLHCFSSSIRNGVCNDCNGKDLFIPPTKGAPFEKIVAHLDRKKARPCWKSVKKEPLKARYSVQTDSASRIEVLFVDYNYYFIRVIYTPGKTLPYSLYMERPTSFGRGRQEVGVRYWDEEFHSQEYVVEYLRKRVR